MTAITRAILGLFIIVGGYWVYHLANPTPWTLAWLDGKSFYYNLSWKGQKTGYVELLFKQDQKGIQVSQNTRIKVINQGVTHRVVEQERYYFDRTSLELQHAEYYRAIDDRVTENKIIRTNQGFKVANSEHTLHIDYTLSDFLQLTHWIRQEPAIGELKQIKKLDLHKLSIVVIDYLLLAKTMDSWQLSFKQQGNDWQGVVELDREGTPRSYQIGELIEQSITNMADALSIEPQGDYYWDNLIALDKPLGDIKLLQQVVLNVDPLAANQLLQSNRQYLNEQGQWVITAGSQPTKQQASLKQQTMSIQQAPKYLKTLAQQLTEGADSEQQKITNLLNFVASYLTYTPVIKSMSLQEILDERQGDCTEHTALFNALANSLGYKTKVKQGLLYLGDELQGFGGHVWSEIELDGYWQAVDATMNLSELTAGHIETMPSATTASLKNLSLVKLIEIKAAP
jgi:protein-glutamine gamma-glutamyltransferase